MTTLLTILGGAILLAQQAPVPDAEKQKESEAMVREVFKAEYAKKAVSERIALARKLLAQAQESKDDHTARYVLLREARDLAVQGADLGTALKAIDLMATGYAVDVVSLKLAAFSSLGKAARTPEEMSPLAAAYLKLSDEATERDQYDGARQAAEAAGMLAKRLKDMPLVTRAESKAREAGERRDRYGKVRKAQETLANSPDDPEANLLMGQFECSVKGDWDRGLRRLAKGSDPALKAQAEADIAGPSDAAAQVQVGDGWWDLAEKAEASQKGSLQDRARHWYRIAVAGTTGLTRAKVDARLRGTWIPLFDGQTLDFMKETSQPHWEVLEGALSKRAGTNEGFQTRQVFLDGEFRIRFEHKGLKHMTFAVRQGVNGKDSVLYMDPQIGPMEGKAHELLFVCKGPDVKAFLDGKPAVLYTRGPAVEGHLQIVGNGDMLKILSLEYRQIK